MAVKYIQLANSLREQLFHNSDGTLYKLPSENALCRQYQVSRQTVRQALSLLMQEGLIETRRGSGSYYTGLGKKENCIAVITNNAEEYTTPALLSDMKAVLRRDGYQLSVYSTQRSLSEERRILLTLLDMPIRGLIAECCRSALPNPNLDLYQRLQDKGVAVLFLHSSYSNATGFVSIKSDNYYGGYLLGKHLLQKGHTRIASVFQIDELQGIERYSGFLNAMRDFGVSFFDEASLWYDSAALNALEQRNDTSFLSSFARKRCQGASAVICQNDEIAYWLIKELHYAGLLVPGDISVASFDNSYLSSLGPVRISSLSHKSHEMGTMAAGCILSMIKGSPVFPQELPWHLTAKESIAAHYHSRA